MCAPCSVQTYQGIDRCGERLAEEVGAYVQQHPALQRISVVGHSMGGLIARYALGDPPLLYKLSAGIYRADFVLACLIASQGVCTAPCCSEGGFGVQARCTTLRPGSSAGFGLRTSSRWRPPTWAVGRATLLHRCGSGLHPYLQDLKGPSVSCTHRPTSYPVMQACGTSGVFQRMWFVSWALLPSQAVIMKMHMPPEHLGCWHATLGGKG